MHGFLNVPDRMGEVKALACELDESETVVASNGENGNKQRSIYGKMFLKLHYVMPPTPPKVIII